MMLTENGMVFDQNAVNEVLARGDVITIGFTLFPQRLLIDTRANDDAGPLVTVADPVASVQERYLWLGRHRGMFGAPQGFSFFVWPHTVRHLVNRDSLGVLRERLRSLPEDGEIQLDDALSKLREMENEEFRNAIRGGQYWKTLWQRA